MSSVPLGSDSEVARATSPKVSYADGKRLKEGIITNVLVEGL